MATSDRREGDPRRIRIKKYTYSHKAAEKAETSFPRTDNLLKFKRFGSVRFGQYKKCTKNAVAKKGGTLQKTSGLSVAPPPTGRARAAIAMPRDRARP